MSQFLSELLEAAEPAFTLSLRQLEQISGAPSADIRLTTDIIGKVHLKLRELGLDPKDTTGQELYHALIGLIRQHDEFFSESHRRPKQW